MQGNIPNLAYLLHQKVQQAHCAFQDMAGTSQQARSVQTTIQALDTVAAAN